MIKGQICTRSQGVDSHQSLLAGDVPKKKDELFEKLAQFSKGKLLVSSPNTLPLRCLN
jgi:hypothetical protein